MWSCKTECKAYVYGQLVGILHNVVDISGDKKSGIHTEPCRDKSTQAFVAYFKHEYPGTPGKENTVYGKAEGDIQPNTLEILNGFDLYTTDNYAIKLPAGSTVIFHGDVLLESKVNCIYSEGSITLKGVSKNNDRHKLTFGSAGISSGLDVTVENLKLKTDPESVESYEYAIEAKKTSGFRNAISTPATNGRERT